MAKKKKKPTVAELRKKYGNKQKPPDATPRAKEDGLTVQHPEQPAQSKEGQSFPPKPKRIRGKTKEDE